MQKAVSRVVIGILMMVLGACTVRGPSVRVNPPSVEWDGYRYNDRHGHPGGYHCPPGQAKKGRC